MNFDNQKVTAKDHGALFSGILTDGILEGCEVSYSGATVNVSTGWFILSGRQVKIESTETKAITGTSGYARMKVAIDLSGTASKDSFTQAEIQVDYASTIEGFPALEKENVNTSGIVYQAELAVLSLGSSGVTGIYRKSAKAHNTTLFVPENQIVESVFEIPADAQDYKLFFVTV